MAQQLAQGDAALEAFDRLLVREVDARHFDTASAVLAKFQSTAASLEPDERIKLVVYTFSDMKPLEAVLADPQASKICVLDWEYRGEEDVHSVIPLLTKNCPELASLQVQFWYHSAFDFVSSVLEHPSAKVKVLEMSEYETGDLPRFFAALGQSRVSALTIGGCEIPEFSQGLCDYLAKDLLVRLKVDMDEKQAPLDVVTSLAKCTCLAKLSMWRCKFSQPTVFANLPKSVTKLKISYSTFVDGCDWSFLADGSGIQKLSLWDVGGVDGNQLGGALAVDLRFDKLCLGTRNFADDALAAIGVEIGRVKRLDLRGDDLNDASIELVSRVLQSPNSEIRELCLTCGSDSASSIEIYLVPALKHPNCNLAKLSLSTYQSWHREAAKTVEDTFCKRRALFVLLQGQQVRRKVPCPLRRLPVEMFRMVGEVLI